MPGPFIHMSAMRHAAQDFASGDYSPPRSDRIDPAWSGKTPAELAGFLQKHPNFASLGAIGPDLFFFLPDFRDAAGVPVSSVLVTVLNFLEGLYEALDPYISKWEHYLGPISEDTAEEMSRLTGGLSETVGDITGELSGILKTALEDFLVDQKDWWEYFSLGANRGWDDQAYLWSDMLHYRETGRFARALWEQAEKLDDDGVRAYALGYMTHLATDVTGHAFVNTISGGPFRSHWQRHHLVENHMDAEWYLRDALSPRSADQYPQLTESALYYDIAFDEKKDDAPKHRPSYPGGDTLRDNWTRKRKLDIDSDLPDGVAQALSEAMIAIFYQGGPHPSILHDNDGRPSTDLIKESYKLLFRFLKLTTVDGFAHEPPEPPDVFPNLQPPTITDPNDEPPGDSDGGSFWDDLLDFLLSVIAAIAYLAELAAYLATLPWAVLADLVTYPLRLGLYYALELPLFHMFKLLRAVLVMTGYLTPMTDEIALGLIHIGVTDNSLFQNLIDDINDTFGGIGAGSDGSGRHRVTFRDEKYPYSHPDDEFHHPWVYPDYALCELPGTYSGPYATGSGPEILFGDLPSDPDIRDRLEKALNPHDADLVGPDLRPTHHLGDSAAFSKYLVWLETRDPEQEDGVQVPLVDWNLDADRGYGYQDWDWNRDPHGKMEKDPEGKEYMPPCTWPQQSGRWNPNQPLELHWTGPSAINPGCAPANPPPIGIGTHANQPRGRRTNKGGNPR